MIQILATSVNLPNTQEKMKKEILEYLQSHSKVQSVIICAQLCRGSVHPDKRSSTMKILKELESEGKIVKELSPPNTFLWSIKELSPPILQTNTRRK